METRAAKRGELKRTVAVVGVERGKPTAPRHR